MKENENISKENMKLLSDGVFLRTAAPADHDADYHDECAEYRKEPHEPGERQPGKR